jgi:hypothetical protein
MLLHIAEKYALLTPGKVFVIILNPESSIDVVFIIAYLFP